MPQTPSRWTISKRAFQVVSLVTLAFPIAATWAVVPHPPRFGEGTDVAFALRALTTVVTPLVFVIVWAVALLTLRRRSTLPPLDGLLLRAE